LLIASSTNAQDITSTGNILAMGGWTGVTTPNPTRLDQGCSRGTGVAMNTATNTLRFSYGMSTATQSVAINTALAAAGAGIKVVGYNYSWQIYNDLSTAGATRGTLTGAVTLTGADNSVLKTYNYNYSSLNTGSAFQTVTGTETFGPQYDPSALKNITVSFTGKDMTFWAGYYGPRVRDADIRLNYMTDPCATNPAYSPSCAGYGSVKTSPNLGQAYNIQTALAHSGTGLTVHGFDYGFNWKTGENCTFEFIFCFEWGPASTGAAAYVTNSQGGVVASKSYGWYSQNQSGTVTDSIRFPTSLNQLSLGTFAITGGGDGGGYISNAWSRMVYSPDPCEKNPLLSSSCTKFVATVMANQKAAQSASSTTVDSTGTVTTTTMSPAASGVTAITTPTAMADPTKNEVTNTNVGGVQLSVAGEVQPVTGVPKVVVRPAPADAPKEKEKEKIVVKLPTTPPAPAPAPRRVKQDDDIGLATAMAAQAASVESAQTQQKTEVQQAQTMAIVQQSITAPVVVRRAIQADSSAVDFGQQETAVVAVNNQLRAAATASSRTRVQQEQFVLPEVPKELAAQQDEVTTKSLSGQGLSVTPLFQGLRPITSFNTEFPQISSSFASNMLSPLRSAMEARPMEGTGTESNQTVKKDVQNNELAGGVDLTKMAIQPAGFGDYLNLALTDAAFYGPKEVYKNQRVVDNARAQRLLQGASDRMHQEMVNSQYNK